MDGVSESESERDTVRDREGERETIALKSNYESNERRLRVSFMILLNRRLKQACLDGLGLQGLSL